MGVHSKAQAESCWNGAGAVRQRRYTEGAQKCRSALLQSRNLGKHPIQEVLFKDGQSVDWNCCGEITLRSELVGLIARPINLGLSMLVLVSSRVTNIAYDGSVAKPEHAQCSHFRSMAEVSFLSSANTRKRASASGENYKMSRNLNLTTSFDWIEGSCYLLICGRCSGLIVRALVSGSSITGLCPGRGHCVVLLGKAIYALSVSLCPGV